MDADKAYILGLLIGGGNFGDNECAFTIRLPYKQWGSFDSNHERVKNISKDIMKVVSPMMRATYGLNISYDSSSSGSWNILCEGITTNLIKDLSEYGIKAEGELRKNSSLKLIAKDLTDNNLKRRFIAGLADTIGSTAKSQRRFNDNRPMLSFEISGYNFTFVCDLCKILHSIECYPDQILWNHPNFHVANNPYDGKWKKGFKLRVQLDQYDKFGAFAFTSKAVAAKDNQKLQKTKKPATPCKNKNINVTPSTVHIDENSPLLPDEIRGCHFIHNRHVCTVLGCPHAPFDEIYKHLQEAGKYIVPFPILFKDTRERVLEVRDSTPILANRCYSKKQLKISDLLEQSSSKSLFYGNNDDTGYQAALILQAFAYLIANDNELRGKRPKGSYMQILKKHIASDSNLFIETYVPDLLTPLIFVHNNRAAMVGAMNPDVYQKLIVYDNDNPYKIKIREITESDFL